MIKGKGGDTAMRMVARSEVTHPGSSVTSAKPSRAPPPPPESASDGRRRERETRRAHATEDEAVKGHTKRRDRVIQFHQDLINYICCTADRDQRLDLLVFLP
ncbi:unnamed protein product [Parajaminaea phylloscopi]